MHKTRIFLWLLILLIHFSSNINAQKKIPSKLEARKTAKLAVKYLNSEKFEKSLETARLSLHYASIIKDNYLIAASYNIIAANFDELSEYDKAILFYKKGLTYANKTDNDTIKNYINNTHEY